MTWQAAVQRSTLGIAWRWYQSNPKLGPCAKMVVDRFGNCLIFQDGREFGVKAHEASWHGLKDWEPMQNDDEVELEQ